MSDFSRDSRQSLTSEELAFGAHVMCAVYFRQEISPDARARFVKLFGQPAAFLLWCAAANDPGLWLLGNHLLITMVPELQGPFMAESARALARSLRFSSTNLGGMTRIAEAMGYRSQPFGALRDQRRTRAASRLAGIRSGSLAGYPTKKFLGRNEPRRIHQTPGLNTTDLGQDTDKD